MTTIEELAEALVISVDALRQLAASADTLYEPPFWQKKASGGKRRIDPPKEPLMTIQGLIKKLLSPLVDSPIAFAIRGRSHVDAARQHPGKGYLGKLDALNFFLSITEGLVREALRSKGFDGEALEILVKLVTLKGRLRQGPPSSPVVANLVLEDFDRRVAETAGQLRVIVTRSTDDFSTSGPTWISVQRTHEFIIEQLRHLGLRMNWGKFSITPHHDAQLVHGISVNRQPAIPKRKKTAGKKRKKTTGKKLSREQVRDRVRRAQRFGCSTDEMNLLCGQLGYMKPLHAREVKNRLAALNDGGS
jgi:hypothetical protein